MANQREDSWRLSEDLTAQILIRLPVKTLIQLKLVCKFWYDLIKSPNFVKLHQQYSSTRNNCMLVVTYDECFLFSQSDESLQLITKIDVDKQIQFTDRFTHACGTCNGLLCMRDISDDTVIFNPATGESKEIDFPSFGFPWRFFDNYMAFGFGIDSINNDYKVVGLISYDKSSEPSENAESDQSHFRVGIYNLRTNSWRKIDHCLDLDYLHRCCSLVPGPAVGGTLHWMVEIGGTAEYILSFNMSTEKFGKVELPDDDLVKLDSEVGFHLTLFSESLALFVYKILFYEDEPQTVDIWVMHEYGVAASWAKQVSIGPMAGIVHPLLLWNNESILLKTSKGQLVSCNLDMAEIIGPEIDVGAIMDTMVYYESLVSVV